MTVMLSIGGVKIVLDVDGLDFVLLGETLNLLVVDGTHKGGLAGTVGTAKTVTLTTLETEMSLVKQNLGTVAKLNVQLHRSSPSSSSGSTASSSAAAAGTDRLRRLSTRASAASISNDDSNVGLEVVNCQLLSSYSFSSMS